MKFKEAKAKLAKIADGKYHSLEYSITNFKSVGRRTERTERAECGVYIDGVSWSFGPTWEAAFKKLDRQLRGLPEVNEEEQPD